jgi:chromosome segregation ATPase
LDAHAIHGASPFQKATPEELDLPTSQKITHEQNSSLSSLPLQPTGASCRPRCVPEEDDDGEDLTVHHAKLVAPDAPSGQEIARVEDRRLNELERRLSETLVAKTERDRRIAQLTGQLAVRSALLEQAAEERKRAGLGLRELQAKLDESLLSRDHALEQAQSALQKVSCAAEVNEQSQRELVEMHAKLEAKESELAAVRLRLAYAEDGWAKSKAEADTLRAQTAAGLVNTDVDQVMHRLLERMRAMELEVSSLRGNEKSIESMECRNEG